MKRISVLVTTFVALALSTGALAQSFTAGNLVIYRVGGNASGATSGSLTNAGTVVWLDEYSTSGVFQTSHMMPTNYFGANSPLIGNGTAFGNGLITTSVDGRFIVLAGFGATLRQLSTSLATSFATVVPRVIGVVGGNGNIDTTTTMTNNASGGSSGGEIRSVVSTDGTNFWTGGDALSGGGLQYTSRFSDSDAITFNALNIRQLRIISNQVYLTSASLLSNHVAKLLNTNDVNTLPTATNNVATVDVAGTTFPPSPWAFVAFKLIAGGANPIDTLYIADGSNSVQKLSLVSGSWTNNGPIGSFHAIGLTGKVRVVAGVTNVDLWVTGGGGTLTGFDNLEAATDSSGYNQTPTVNADDNVLVTSPSSVSFRGIVFAPVGGDGTLSGAGNISVGPVIGLFANGDTGCSLSSSSATQTYSVANLGTTGPISWQGSSDSNWVSLSPSSGSLPSGGSVTVSAFFNNNITSLPGSLFGVTNTATITFTNTTSGVGTTTRAVRLIQRDQDITPSTDYVISGAFGGPFSPTNKNYTVFNGSTSILLTVSKSQSWLNLSFNSGTLAGCASNIIAVSVNTNVANSLVAGNYSDVISFSNATAGTLIDTRSVSLTVGGIMFCDDFSTFTQNSALEGQVGWIASGANPSLTVSNNAVYNPAATTAIDEPYKNIPLTSNGYVYAAMVISITSAPPVSTASPSRGPTFFTLQNEGGFARDFVSARDTGTNQFVFVIRVNAAGNGNVFGTTPLDYNTQYRVIVRSTAFASSNQVLWVNPASTENTNTAYLVQQNVGAADTGVGCFSLQSQFGANPIASPGYAVFKVCITTNYADAYNDIQSFGPPSDPFTTWQSQYFGCTGCPQAAGGADPDGDGMSNTNEFLAGFNPTNNAAYLHIISVARSSTTNIVVTYLGANGNSTTTPPSTSRTNVLEFTNGNPGTAGSYSNNFASTGQINVLSGGTGLGTITSFVDTNGASGATKYYRVRVLVP
jgi:hypothetical protein